MKQFIIPFLVILALFSGCTSTKQPSAATTSLTYFDKPTLEQKSYDNMERAQERLKAYHQEYIATSGYILFLNRYVATYDTYLKSVADTSAFIKYMPIPYAGQVSTLASVGAKTALLLTQTSQSLTLLNEEIHLFNQKTDAYAKTHDASQLRDAIQYADKTLIPQMNSTITYLQKLNETSSSMAQLSSSIEAYSARLSNSFSAAASLFSPTHKQPKAPNVKSLQQTNDGFNARVIKTVQLLQETKDSIFAAKTIYALSAEL